MQIFATGEVNHHLSYHPLYLILFFFSLIYFVSSFFSIFAGKIVDKTGSYLFFIMISTLSMILTHCCIAFTYLSPYLCSSAIGIIYAFAAGSIWPIVSVVVEGEDRVATAYGIMQSIQNLGLALANLFVGSVIDKYGYFVLEIIFIFILMCK